MTSLAFELLDTHVISGNADRVALVLPDRRLTFAQALHESAVIASGMRILSDLSALDISSAHPSWGALGLLAATRLTIPIEETSRVRLVDHSLVFADEEIPLSDVVSIGRTDPLVAPEYDDPGYREDMMARFGQFFGPLLAAETAELGSLPN